MKSESESKTKPIRVLIKQYQRTGSYKGQNRPHLRCR